MMDTRCPFPHFVVDSNPFHQNNEEADCNCDCACATSFELQESRSRATHLQSDTNVQADPCMLRFPFTPGSQYLCLNSTQKPVLINKEVAAVLDSFCQPRRAADLPEKIKSVVDQPEYEWIVQNLLAFGLLTRPNTSVHPPEQDNHTLTAWLHITDRCNLRCRYCYLPHETKDMSLDVGQRAIDALIKTALQNRFSSLKLKFAGGEPALNPGKVFSLWRYALSEAEKNSLQTSAVFLSNGTLLTQAVLEQIKAAGMKLMISLDGIYPDHEQLRPAIDQAPSFSRTIRAIKLCQDIGISPYISITVTAESLPGLPKLVHWLTSQDLPFGLNFYREQPGADCHSIAESEMLLGDALSGLYDVLSKNVSQRSMLATLVDRGNLSMPHLRACGVGRNYLVIDTDGRVAKCQMDMEHPFSSIEDSDLVRSLRTAKSGLENPSVEDKSECAACQWKYYCCGGCALLAFRNHHSYQSRSPYCQIYQQLFPKVLNLEAARLLKYGQRLSHAR